MSNALKIAEVGEEQAAAEKTAKRRAKKPRPALDPLWVGAEQVGQMLFCSERTIWTRNAGGLIPRPHKFVGLTVWEVAEIKEWIAAGKPDRATWEKRRAAKAR